MSNKILTWLNIVLAVLILSTVLFTGCSLFYGKNITIDKGIAHFYFECPDRYKVDYIDVYDEPDLNGTHVKLLGPAEGESRITPQIDINIDRPFEGRQDEQAAWEYDIRFYQVYDNFEILSSSSTIIDGIQANKYMISFNSSPDPYRDPPDL